jgi:hypothetical protein
VCDSPAAAYAARRRSPSATVTTSPVHMNMAQGLFWVWMGSVYICESPAAAYAARRRPLQPQWRPRLQCRTCKWEHGTGSTGVCVCDSPAAATAARCRLLSPEVTTSTVHMGRQS